MAERHAASVRIDAVHRKAPEVSLDPGAITQPLLVLERPDGGEDLSGERLVDLPQVDLLVA